MLFFSFPISSYLIEPNATSTGYSEAYANTSQSNLLSCYIQIIKSHLGETHNHQKAESLRAPSFSKLDNMVNSNSIFNTKCAEFSTCTYNHSHNVRHQLLHILPCSQNHTYTSHKYSLSL